jgi:hypothetical protein
MNDMPNKPHIVMAENARKIWDWLNTRGGLAIWGCVDLSALDKSWTTPLNDADGKPTAKPHWAATTEPVRVITDSAEVVVSTPKEVDRFKVATRLGAQGLKIKLTDHSTKKLRDRTAKSREKHGSAFYKFDYGTQEAVIYADTQVTPIADFIKTLDASDADDNTVGAQPATKMT